MVELQSVRKDMNAWKEAVRKSIAQNEIKCNGLSKHILRIITIFKKTSILLALK